CLVLLPLDVGIRCYMLTVFFFFQAEDGIRDFHVTGVQTCALPISSCVLPLMFTRAGSTPSSSASRARTCVLWGESFGRSRITVEIGRASCRESVELRGGRKIGKETWSETR